MTVNSVDKIAATVFTKDMEATPTYALRSNFDGHVYPERFTAAEAAAAMRLDPWLVDPNAGDVTLVEVPS